MTNLARSQDDWTKLFREIGLILAVKKLLVDVRRKFNEKYARVQVVHGKVLNETAYTAVTTFALAGVNIGTNTDEKGRIFVRITDESPGAGQATVDLYKTTGGGGSDKVATGSGANGATITLAAANSSGLTGTCVLGTVAASESDDKHVLYCFPDFPVRANTLFDGSEAEHTASLKVFLAMCVQIEQQINGAIGIADSTLLAFGFDRWANFQKSAASALISRDTTVDEGAVTLVNKGLLEDTRQNMVDEGTGGAQKVLKNVLSAGSATFDSNNQGLGAMTAPTLKEWPGLPGLITAICVDATIGSEAFELSMKVSTTGEVIRAKNRLTVKKTYADPFLGIAGALLSRTHTITTPSSSTLHFSTTSGDYSFTGESDKNTNDGILYGVIRVGVVDPAKFIMKLYKSASLGSDQLVAESEEGAAGATVALVAKNNSRLTGTGKLGSAPVVGNTATINLNTFRVQNTAAQVPDKFTIAITRTSLGEFQRRIAELGYALNSATAGSQTITDDMASAGSFVPYSVSDA